MRNNRLEVHRLILFVVQIPQASKASMNFKTFRNWSIDLTWKLGFKFFILYSIGFVSNVKWIPELFM